MDEREFELINIIGAELVPNQRDISRQMDLSLGMTNMLIHRLLTKGYIRIKQLNKKKVEYILTPKGFAEKMQKSIKYTMKTINSIGRIWRKKGKLPEAEYEKIRELAWDKCVLCMRCYCPLGISIPTLIATARSACRERGVQRWYSTRRNA